MSLMPRKIKKYSVSQKMQAILEDPALVMELTDEEIKRGKLMASDGTFKGRPAPMVPLKFYEIMRQEQIRRWEIAVAETLQPSLKVLKDIADGKIQGRVPADARMKSAIYLIERTVGKVPDKVEAKVSVAKWEEDIESLLYEPPDKKE